MDPSAFVAGEEQYSGDFNEQTAVVQGHTLLGPPVKLVSKLRLISTKT